MAIFRLIPAGDVALTEPDPTTGKRTLVVATGTDYVRQKISSRLKMFIREWFLDLREGVPYYRDVFVKNPNVDLIRAVFRTVILSVQEVGSVNRLLVSYDSAARTLAVEFDASLVTGGVLTVRQPDEPFIISVQQRTT